MDLPKNKNEAAQLKQEVFSECLEIVLKPLMQLSHSGFSCDGDTLYPLFYCYVHDHPEGCKVRFGFLLSGF